MIQSIQTIQRGHSVPQCGQRVPQRGRSVSRRPLSVPYRGQAALHIDKGAVVIRNLPRLLKRYSARAASLRFGFCSRGPREWFYGFRGQVASIPVSWEVRHDAS
jgi:hypothetical protein